VFRLGWLSSDPAEGPQEADMTRATGDYTDWCRIDYSPKIAMLPIVELESHLTGATTALEIGCGTGATTLQLAERGLDVVGIDISYEAIRKANQHAPAKTLGQLRFVQGDILRQTGLGKFDLVVMIRFLTCFPTLEHWESVLRSARSHLNAGGLLYVHDFLALPESETYRHRYEEGAAQGWRPGNFALNDADGNLVFIAHHHTPAELGQIAIGYETILLDTHDSLSMNGNPCRMFEFLGRSTRPDGTPRGCERRSPAPM
jgi:SAM-dependent methyltransferase